MKHILSTLVITIGIGSLLLAADEQKPAVPEKPKAEAKKVPPKKVQVKAVQAMIQIGAFNNRFGANIAVRESVDRQDNVERFLLLAPRGPIVVEAAIQLDGKPFRNAREKLIDEMMKAADTNGDGKATWKEALANTRFLFGRAATRVVLPVKPQPQPKEEEKEDGKDKKKDEKEKPKPKQAAAVQMQFKVIQLGPNGDHDAAIAHFDTNENGKVDRNEARQLLAQTSGGPAYTVAGAYNRFREPDVKSVLDVNKDGQLSKDELAGAAEQLKTKDANDNDLLEPQELGGQGTRNINGQVIMIRAFGNVQANRSTAGHLLGPTMDANAVHEALKKKYGGKDEKLTSDSFGLFPNLFGKLDKNSNGELETAEVANLNTVPAHIQLDVNLGNTKPSGIAIKSMAKELQGEAKLPEGFNQTAATTLSDVKLQFSIPASARTRSNYKQIATKLFERYDTNKDGKIELKEMQKLNQAFKQQFQRWDINSDKEVVVGEIVESYRRQQAPMLSRVSTAVGEQGPSLFGAIDVTGDKRLSLREMKTAGERLLSRDKNNDGQIDLNEMPVQIAVAFNQGNAYSNVFATAATGRPGANNKPAQPQKGPEWFTRMDRNGDGDVTLREFVGSEEQFKKLDTNGDGFIELKEAQAVKLPGQNR